MGVGLGSGEVAPVFVHPHPAFGILADGLFKGCPDLLGECGDICVGLGADGVENLHAVAAVFPGDADAGDDGKAEPLGEGDVEGGHAGL